MKFDCLHRIIFCIILLIMPVCCLTTSAKDFVVVIDAGHGGHDSGAVGKRGKEKNINLNVALKVGKLIEQNCKGVKVIYTRKKDVFVTLDGRARIANNAKADLFISIHTNSVAKGRTVKGTETYTLGLHRTADNLEVAKRENSVILIEDNYQQRYAGFNPNSSESYIIFELVQDKDMKKSVRLATLVQNSFKSSAKRIDRGVHQAGFLVLRETYMPSILIELGYISTPEEENYLLSEAGSSSLATSIYKAFVNYKREHDAEAKNDKSKQTAEVAEPVMMADPTPVVTNTATNESPVQGNKNSESVVKTSQPVFMIQFYISSKKLPANSAAFKGLSPVTHFVENGTYKYTYGEDTNYNKVLQSMSLVRKKFKDAFMIAFKDGKKMNLQDAITEYKNRK